MSVFFLISARRAGAEFGMDTLRWFIIPIFLFLFASNFEKLARLDKCSNQGWKKTVFFYKKTNPLGFFNKTRVLLFSLCFLGFLVFLKRK